VLRHRRADFFDPIYRRIGRYDTIIRAVTLRMIASRIERLNRVERFIATGQRAYRTIDRLAFVACHATPNRFAMASFNSLLFIY
jgi:hypothetical protein